jgi:hypothetical protein
MFVLCFSHLSTAFCVVSCLVMSRHKITDNSIASQLVAEINLLLTGGRLNDTFAAFITSEYSRMLTATGNATTALKYVQKMVILAPEFHTTNANLQTPVIRPDTVR